MNGQGQFFDATQFAPEQGGGPQHPVGTFPAKITATTIEPTRDSDGNYLKIEYSTPQGKAYQRLNLWNNSTQAVEIAQKQLSAVCYATGVHRLDMANQGRELHDALCTIEVRQQVKNPSYTEIARVMDKNGVDPKELAGGRGSATTQQTPSTQPFNAASGGSGGGSAWPSSTGGFGGGSAGGGTPPGNGQSVPFQQQPQQQPQQQQDNSGGGWTPGNSPAGAPWANR